MTEQKRIDMRRILELVDRWWILIFSAVMILYVATTGEANALIEILAFLMLGTSAAALIFKERQIDAMQDLINAQKDSIYACNEEIEVLSPGLGAKIEQEIEAVWQKLNTERMPILVKQKMNEELARRKAAKPQEKSDDSNSN